MAESLSRFQRMEINTAIGYLVPVIANKIESGGLLHSCDMGFEFFSQWPWEETTSKKALGDMAEACFQKASAENLFRLPIFVSRYDAYEDQCKGKDYACRLPLPVMDIEVKCEKNGGIWGTGNLFVQTNESPAPDEKAPEEQHLPEGRRHISRVTE